MPADLALRPHLAVVEPATRPVPAADLDLDLAEISPRLLRCFVTVAEELHFGRAADRLYVAQPALSRSIQQLERLLGRTLFVRTTRSVEPTPCARTLLGPAREVLQALHAMAGELGDAHRALRIAHPPDSDVTALVLDQLGRDGAAVPVQETVLGAAEQLEAVREGRLDVALCRAPRELAAGLRATLVRLDPLLVAVIGRDPSILRPVDVTRRTVAVADGGDGDFAEVVAQYEQRVGCTLRRVPIPFGSGTEAFAMRRAGAHAFLTLASRGVRLDARCATFGAAGVQAYYPWSVVWRAGSRSPGVPAFVEAARRASAALGWLDVDALPGEPWIPTEGAGEEPRWALAS